MTPILIAAPEDIGPLLREMREARGWSTSRTGSEAGYGQGHISLIENSRRIPSVPTLIALLDTFGHQLAITRRGAQ